MGTCSSFEAMENTQVINADFDLYNLLADLERNVTDGPNATTDNRKRQREITIEPTFQLNDNQSIQLVDSSGDFIASQMVIPDKVNDEPKEKKQKADFSIDSPFIDMLKKINKLRVSKRNMSIEIKDMKKQLVELRELVSFLKDKIDTTNTTKNCKKNSVMGQLEIIKEILTNMQK